MSPRSGWTRQRTSTSGMALLYDAPPKVIRLRIGNGLWRSAAEVTLANVDAVREFLDDPEGSLLILQRLD